jgi:hypothetical protein
LVRREGFDYRRLRHAICRIGFQMIAGMDVTQQQQRLTLADRDPGERKSGGSREKRNDPGV